MSWPCCPVCKRDWRFGERHVTECPWQALIERVATHEKQTGDLLGLTERLTSLLHETISNAERLRKLVFQLDDRTIGLAKMR